MIPTRTFRGIDNNVLVSVSCTNKEDDSTSAGDLSDNLCGATKIREGGVQGNDVDTIADAEDVGTVAWIPEGGGMAEVGLCCQKHGKCQFVRGGWRNEVEGWGIGGLGAGTERSKPPLGFAVRVEFMKVRKGGGR